MPNFAAAPFKVGDRVAVYCGTPRVDSGLIGTITRLDSDWLVLRHPDQAETWMPAGGITGMYHLDSAWEEAV